MTDYPRIVPEVYETSDGKLHTTEVAAEVHQHRLDLEIPLSKTITQYWHHAHGRFRDFDAPRPAVFQSLLAQHGLKIVKDTP